MSKFDRCIFISIAIGIWALAMTQVFKPEILEAGITFKTTYSNPTYVHGYCPNFIKEYQGNTR